MVRLTLWSLAVGIFCSVDAKETVQDAARLTRALLHEESIGSLATVFPANHPSLPNEPFSLMEYFASCHANGSLTFMFLPIAQNNRNILQSPTHSATLTVRAPSQDSGSWDSPASRGRVALIGNVTVLGEDASQGVEQCYFSRHPDAKDWAPGREDSPHTSYWARFDPHHVYWVGGFGDTHYIGYIPLELYQTAFPTLNNESHSIPSLVSQISE